jgi:hypothetical protein
MNRRYPKIEKEIDELINSKDISSESIYNLFLKYESNNVKQINKLTRNRKIEVNRIKDLNSFVWGLITASLIIILLT